MPGEGQRLSRYCDVLRSMPHGWECQSDLSSNRKNISPLFHGWKKNNYNNSHDNDFFNRNHHISTKKKYYNSHTRQTDGASSMYHQTIHNQSRNFEDSIISGSKSIIDYSNREDTDNNHNAENTSFFSDLINQIDIELAQNESLKNKKFEIKKTDDYEKVDDLDYFNDRQTNEKVYFGPEKANLNNLTNHFLSEKELSFIEEFKLELLKYNRNDNILHPHAPILPLEGLLGGEMVSVNDIESVSNHLIA